MTMYQPTRSGIATRFLRLIGRILASVGWIVCGTVAYFICQGMSGGYPNIHSRALTRLGMVLIAVTGAVAWIVDERRDDDDH